MPSHDKQGRAYLKLTDAKSGMQVALDDGFTCIEATTVTLSEDKNGIYFQCKYGHHHIDGQADDGIHCIGIYPF